MKKLICAAAIAISIAGCAEEKFVGRPGLQVVQDVSLPPPTAQDKAEQLRPYVIGPLDIVTIDVFGVPDLTRKVQVDGNGRISLPLAGDIQASGLAPSSLSATIENRLRGRYVRDPHVSVNVDTVNQSIVVGGEVTEPGIYPIAGRVELSGAIARARGLTEFARPNYVVVFRTVANQKMAALYDLRQIRAGVYPDPEIFANDVITVGDSQARRTFKTLIAASPTLIAPLVAILR